MEVSDNVKVLYTEAYNAFTQENYAVTKERILAIDDELPNYWPGLFLFGSTLIVEGNILDGFNVFEQILEASQRQLSLNLLDEILEITEHFIYYDELAIESQFPNVALLYQLGPEDFKESNS